ncbi:unnamed protein product, partial [Urochloa humidicola]
LLQHRRPPSSRRPPLGSGGEKTAPLANLLPSLSIPLGGQIELLHGGIEVLFVKYLYPSVFLQTSDGSGSSAGLRRRRWRSPVPGPRPPSARPQPHAAGSARRWRLGGATDPVAWRGRTSEVRGWRCGRRPVRPPRRRATSIRRRGHMARLAGLIEILAAAELLQDAAGRPPPPCDLLSLPVRLDPSPIPNLMARCNMLLARCSIKCSRGCLGHLRVDERMIIVLLGWYPLPGQISSYTFFA